MNKNETFKPNLAVTNDRGERHNCCVALDAILSGKYTQVIFLSDDLRALRDYAQSVFDIFPLGSIWTLFDFIKYYSPYSYPFMQGLEDLVDHLPNYFTLLINLTMASHSLPEDIESRLGRSLINRITKDIYFREPDENEAFEYVKDLMRQYRTADFEQSGLSATYPFNEDALRVLIADLPFRTPHFINQCCAYIIEEALKQGIIHNTGEGTIDAQFVRNVEDEYLRFDMR